MTEQELIKLKAKADNGDVESCVEYALEMHDHVGVSGQKDINDSAAKYMYDQNSISNNDALFRLIYQKSTSSFKEAFNLIKLFYELEID